MKITREIKRFFKFLRIDLSILVQNMRIYLGNHVGFGMSRIALCRFQIAVVQFQLIGGNSNDGASEKPPSAALRPHGALQTL